MGYLQDMTLVQLAIEYYTYHNAEVLVELERRDRISHMSLAEVLESHEEETDNQRVFEFEKTPKSRDNSVGEGIELSSEDYLRELRTR